MKPAPPKVQRHKIGQYIIVAEPRNVTSKNQTKIFHKSDKEKPLWIIDIYSGSHGHYLSPDGTTLILTGNEYFGNTVQNNDTATMVTVYQKDADVKFFTFKDITEQSLPEIVEKQDLAVKGGNWVYSGDLLEVDSINWKKRTIKFKGSVKAKELSF